MDSPQEYSTLLEAVSTVSDPRKARGKQHEWRVLLTLICAAMASGQKSVRAMATHHFILYADFDTALAHRQSKPISIFPTWLVACVSTPCSPRSRQYELVGCTLSCPPLGPTLLVLTFPLYFRLVRRGKASLLVLMSLTAPYLLNQFSYGIGDHLRPTDLYEMPAIFHCDELAV